MRTTKIMAAVLIATGGLIGTAQSPAAAKAPAPAAAQCAASSTVKETLPNGTTWELCWRIEGKSGLVLENVLVSSKRWPDQVKVLKSVTLAQLNVPYDSGKTEYNDITEYGFGGEYLQTLAGDDCKGGSARVGSDGGAEPTRREVLCVSAESSGLAYRLQNDDSATKPYSKQGHDLVLRALSKVGWYEYVTEYRLHDDGEISARLGATGDLSPLDWVGADKGWPIGKGNKDFASSHYHSAFWRVDFDLAGRGSEKVEQYDTKVTGQGDTSAVLKTSRTAITNEGSFSKANRRWWRVVSPIAKNKDGHARSYELVTGASDVYEAHPETTPDVTFTQNHACERYATGNADPQCAGRATILDFARDKEKMTNPVMWVRVGFHHVPRDEDQSPMPLHWQGFDLVPRDFTEINRLAPDALADNNGQN
ncbi:primary-amine oxidase [Actinoplanes friuliensis]|jgi:primary-amine oxidase|uniref:Amine oxidase n=1 Tax=Actinoplanes friuliensis DSM 7358 TaxID=1246995 RepID=U5VYS6_9ACTN|nr:primary-amine oxidase [Actinoplanes friuliensis]AGZ42103.1 primary-amine oxidase [Actinoplanes friuliensis DSM 7358]